MTRARTTRARPPGSPCTRAGSALACMYSSVKLIVCMRARAHTHTQTHTQTHTHTHTHTHTQRVLAFDSCYTRTHARTHARAHTQHTHTHTHTRAEDTKRPHSACQHGIQCVNKDTQRRPHNTLETHKDDRTHTQRDRIARASIARSSSRFLGAGGTSGLECL